MYTYIQVPGQFQGNSKVFFFRHLKIEDSRSLKFMLLGKKGF